MTASTTHILALCISLKKKDHKTHGRPTAAVLGLRPNHTPVYQELATSLSLALAGHVIVGPRDPHFGGKDKKAGQAVRVLLSEEAGRGAYESL